MTPSNKKASELRSELGHPVIDNDGHTLENPAVLSEFIAEVGGGSAADQFNEFMKTSRLSTQGRRRATTLAERRDGWMGQTSFWGHTANTYDRATAMAPRLMLERLGELGIDFGILYPTDGLFANRMEGEGDLRQICCRAVNIYQMEMFKGCERQLIPVAAIPLVTPDEALEELDYAVNSLGYRTVLLTSGSRRPIPKVEREYPDASHLTKRFDFYAIDSEYDYDPVWQKMVDLKVPATFHGQTIGTWFGPMSPSNNTFNRLAAVGYSYPALLLALLLGGVVNRFPKLKFMFQEGGAGWMASLYCSVIGVGMKRGGGGVQSFNPARLDVGKLAALVSEWGTDRDRLHLDWIETLDKDLIEPEVLDDFAAIGYNTPEEFRDIFVSHFYAGCEADDFTNGFAYAKLPYGATLRTTFGSDVGHWDVLDARECLPEAVELLDDGILSAEQLQAFLFDNAYELYTSSNADFFKGTVLEDYAPASC